MDQERAFANEQLTRAILRERISSEEERAKAKHLVSIKDLGELSCLPGHLRCWGEAEYSLPTLSVYQIHVLFA